MNTKVLMALINNKQNIKLFLVVFLGLSYNPIGPKSEPLFKNTLSLYGPWLNF